MILAESIPKFYKRENAEVYFDGKKGILYSKSTNMINKWREKGLYEEPSRKKPKIDVGDATEKTLLLRTEELNSDIFVRSNPFSSGEDFDRHWMNSKNVRINMINSNDNSSLCEILAKYKTYTRPDGFYYVSLS